MTKPDLMRLVAHADRLWLGAKLADAMLADPLILDSWLEVLGPVDAAIAREAVNSLARDGDRFAPAAGQVFRRAQEIAVARRPALADPDLFRKPTPEEQDAVARRMPELKRQIADLSARRALRVVE